MEFKNFKKKQSFLLMMTVSLLNDNFEEYGKFLDTIEKQYLKDLKLLRIRNEFKL